MEKLSDNRDEKRRKKISPFTNEDLWLNELVIWDGFTQQLGKRDEILILKNGGTVRKTPFFLKTNWKARTSDEISFGIRSGDLWIVSPVRGPIDAHMQPTWCEAVLVPCLKSL